MTTSTTINDGGSAFPLVAETHEHVLSIGVTLRDYFAAKAMPVMYTDPHTLSDYRSDESAESFAQYVAKTAYEMADAMLKARSGA